MKKAILFTTFLCIFSFINAQTIVQGEWERISEIPGSRILKLEMRGQNVYARTPMGIFVSSDKGYTWEKFEYNFDYNVALDGTIFYNSNRVDSTGANYNIFRYSKDNGATWVEKEFKDSIERIYTPLHSGEWLRTTITIDPSPFNSSKYAEYYISNDQGVTWTFQSKENISFPNRTNSRVVEISPGIFFRPKSLTGGSFISNDNCKTWNFKGFKLDDSDFQIPLFKTLKNGEIWAMGEFRMERSEDRGMTWERIFTPISSSHGYRTHLPLESGIILSQEFNSDHDDNARTRTTYKSTDGGSTWEIIDFPIDVTIQPVEFDDGEVLGHTYRLMRSKDLGKSWEFTGEGLNQSSIFDLQPITKDTIILKTGFRYLRSFDAGDNWEIFHVDSARHYYIDDDRISKRVNGNIIFATQQKVFLTKDLGTSVKNITPPDFGKSNTGTALVSAIAPSGEFIVSSLDGTFVSHDEGANWFLSDSSHFRKIKFSPSGVWVVQVPFSSPGGCARSFDKGRTWEKLPKLSYGDAFDFDKNDNLFFKKNEKLFRSEDNGETAVSLGNWNFGEGYYIKFRFDDQGLILCTSSDKVYLSNINNVDYMIFPPVDSSDIIHPQGIGYTSVYLSEDNYLFLKGGAGELFRFNRPTTDFADLTPTSDLVFLKNNIKIFPNPTQNQFTISLPGKSNTESNLFIFNNLGQKVFEQRLPKNQIEHRIENFFLPEGVYYFLVKNKEGNIGNGKVIISKN